MKTKRNAFKIKTGKVIENINKIEIFSRGQAFEFLSGIYLPYIFNHYKLINVVFILPWIFPKINFDERLNDSQLKYKIFSNKFIVKRQFFGSKIKLQKLLCIEFKKMEDLLEFYNKYGGIFITDYIVAGGDKDFVDFFERVKDKIDFVDCIEENDSGFYTPTLDNYDILSFRGRCNTYYEITSKNKKLLDEINNEISEKLNLS